MLTLLQASSTSTTSLPWAQQGIGGFLGNIFLWVVVPFIVYNILLSGLQSWFRRANNEIGILTVNILRTPLLLILILSGLKLLLLNVELESIPLIQRVFTAGIVAVSVYLINQLFTQVISYALSKYAEKTEADWDDVLVPLIKSTAPIIIYLVGTFIFLQTLGIDLSGLWVAFGGATFVLGFALQDILSNFFSGLVILIDTPFQFGDVIALEDGSVAVIKNVGIRLTTLYLIENNCELFIPNAALESQKIINFSRPNPNYYYTIIVPIRGDSNPNQAIKIIEEVVLSHPDVLGDLDKKLVAIDNFYRVTDQLVNAQENLLSKKDAGKKRLLAEKKVKAKLQEIEEGMNALIAKIGFMEKGGLETSEIRTIQGYYLDIVKMVGLEIVSEKQKGGQKSLTLAEAQTPEEDTLISLVRNWYHEWQEDPDVLDQDDTVLESEWERKITFLGVRMNKFLQQIVGANQGMAETKLDDYAEELWQWIQERFQTYSIWQAPKIWMNSMSMGSSVSIDMAVKFFVDNVKLEQCQRGNRIKSEVHGEIVRRLRQAYFYR